MPGHDIETRNGKWFRKQIEELKKLQVRVGFQHGKESDGESGADIADIALWNEMGTEHSPSRPFLRQSVENHKDQITAMCRAQLQSLAKGGATAQKVLSGIGATQKGIIQYEIREGNFEPNAPITIEGGWMRRKGGKPFYVKGKKSKRPLIDTGRMMQSVNFVIKPKGEESD